MLLSERRQALIYICLAGMEAAWATPFFLLFYRRVPSPLGPAQGRLWAAYLVLVTALLAWILILDLLNRADVRTPLYEAVTLGLMALTSLLVLRVVLYGSRPPADLSWLGQAVVDIVTFRGGLPPGLVLILTSLFLWQRATSATSRDLSFFNVGVSFRLGMLVLIVGAGLVGYLQNRNLIPLLWLYFGFGLTAVAIARIREKASDAQSAGRTLPARRLVQLLLAVGLTVGVTGFLSLIYTPEAIRRSLRLLIPLWKILRPLLVGLALILINILNPLFVWLERWLKAVFERGWVEMTPRLPQPPVPDQQPGLLERLPRGFTAALGNVLLVLVIIGVAVLVIGFLLLYLERTRRGATRVEDEEEGTEPITLGGGSLNRGLQSLRDVGRLVRRFGIGRQLLAAVSVQNIYANVCRLARQRGYARRPAQPPDDYLPTLARAFEGHEAELARITAAYMRVHYGDHPVSVDELGILREDYRVVRQARPQGP